MTDLPEPLAPLQIAELDADKLSELVTDIEALGEELEIIVKRGPGYVENHGEITMANAVELLTRGLAHGVQLRYWYRGVYWWDTLMRTPDGVRIVRTQHDAQPAKEMG